MASASRASLMRSPMLIKSKPPGKALIIRSDLAHAILVLLYCQDDSVAYNLRSDNTSEKEPVLKNRQAYRHLQTWSLTRDQAKNRNSARSPGAATLRARQYRNLCRAREGKRDQASDHGPASAGCGSQSKASVPRREWGMHDYRGGGVDGRKAAHFLHTPQPTVLLSVHVFSGLLLQSGLQSREQGGIGRRGFRVQANDHAVILIGAHADTHAVGAHAPHHRAVHIGAQTIGVITHLHRHAALKR